MGSVTRKLALCVAFCYNTLLRWWASLLGCLLRRLNAHRATVRERRLGKEAEGLRGQLSDLRREQEFTDSRHQTELEILKNQLEAAEEAVEIAEAQVERFRRSIAADSAVFQRIEELGKRAV